MKRFVSLLTAVLISAIAFAQGSEHLTFKGVPIDGTLASFTQKLSTKGFKKIGTEGRSSILKGTFAGSDNCTVLVQAVDNKDLVYLVGVMFPSMNDWRRLEDDYFTLKEMLTKKYGEPVGSIEEFQHNYVNDDNSKLHELQMNRCNYETVFETDKGRIKLSIAHNDYLECYVILGYVDGSNGALSADAAYDDL
ncbi:MAG: hypothetical protein MJZ27_01195 [Bacteroidales bacterium]|nr:hypothetical protein [Bacteroidales bacterium]